MNRPLRSWEGGFDLERSKEYSFCVDFCQVIFLTFSANSQCVGK